MFGIGTPELIVIAIVILVLFGAAKIPTFMRGLGQGVREFKNAANSVKTEIESTNAEDSKKAASDKTLS